jgi:hypothetical protein
MLENSALHILICQGEKGALAAGREVAPTAFISKMRLFEPKASQHFDWKCLGKQQPRRHCTANPLTDILCGRNYFYYICELILGLFPIFSLHMTKNDFILEIYKDDRTVFRLSDIAMLFSQEDIIFLSDRLNYYVHTNKILNPRKGIYAKSGYNPLELANILYTPSYISLEYVLQRSGIVFQYDSSYTSISYLSRSIGINGKTYSYRRIKEEIIMDTTGIIRDQNINIAIPERAFLDILYLNKDFYVDNINPLDKQLIENILPIYKSVALEKRVANLIQNG